MKAKLKILGCGNSSGVPATGNIWGECDPNEPRNRRRRCSVAVQSQNTTLIIDTGPEFREQMNEAGISDVDAVLYTHAHGDHVNGVDDLRILRFRQKKLIPVYGNSETLAEMKKRFAYMFDGGDHEIYPPVLNANELDLTGGDMLIGDILLGPFAQDHGTCTSTGYRFGDLAYSVDMIALSDDAIDSLKGIKTWIVDCAAYKDDGNIVHANYDKIFALNEKIGAEHVYLTSLSLAMDYQTMRDELPEGFAPAYDGLEIDIVL